MERWDVAIVGAGIAGLSLAWHLNRAGKRVIVLEQTSRAQGASVRNFGMIWVVGQPPGFMNEIATRSRELWIEAADDLGFWIRRTGSLTLAYEEIEAQVIKEYLTETVGSCGRRFLDPTEVKETFPFLRSHGLKGGMYSETEAAVDPREVVHSAASALAKRGVEMRFETTISQILEGRLSAMNGDEFLADKIVVCPGPGLHHLYPGEYEDAGLVQTRLQMLRMKPVCNEVKPLGILLCAGLTLGHYANFQDCPSLPILQNFHASKWPKQVESGIHVLVAEHPDGTITVGDSHHRGFDLPPYRDEAVDDAILEAMDEFLPCDHYEIVQRWEGTYNSHPTLPYWLKQINASTWALNLFGTGMTLSFGLTEKLTKELFP